MIVFRRKSDNTSEIWALQIEHCRLSAFIWCVSRHCWERRQVCEIEMPRKNISSLLLLITRLNYWYVPIYFRYSTMSSGSVSPQIFPEILVKKSITYTHVYTVYTILPNQRYYNKYIGELFCDNTIYMLTGYLKPKHIWTYRRLLVEQSFPKLSPSKY